MLYAYRAVRSVGLKVKLPMVLGMDNSGAVDLVSSWSAGGRTRHADARMHLLRKLEEQGLLEIVHIPGEENESDILAENTPPAIYNKHIVKFVGKDGYVVGPDGACR